MRNLVLYFVLAYLISWTIWLPLILPEYGYHALPALPKYHHYLGSFGPMIAAMIVTFLTNGWNGVVKLFRRLFQWQVRLIWYVTIILIPILLVIITGSLAEQINNQEFSMKGFSTNKEFPEFGPITYFIFNLFTFGIGEETGWRGYALPALQDRFSALTSTVLLSIGWACWHIPAFIYRPLYSQMDIPGIAGFFISLLMGSIILTWIYNSTRGSLFIVAIFHAMIELMFMSENITPKISTYLGALIMVSAILIIILKKATNLSSVHRQTLTNL